MPPADTVVVLAGDTEQVIASDHRPDRARVRERVADIAVGVATAAAVALLRHAGVWP
jgi:hypothetical protein